MFLSDDDIREVCLREPQCFCPEPWKVKGEVANTPEYIRRYFMELGMRACKLGTDKKIPIRVDDHFNCGVCDCSHHTYIEAYECDHGGRFMTDGYEDKSSVMSSCDRCSDEEGYECCVATECDCNCHNDEVLHEEYVEDPIDGEIKEDDIVEEDEEADDELAEDVKDGY